MSIDDNLESTNTIYGIFYSLKDDLITKQLKQYSAHTRNELAMLKSIIFDSDNIIDLGAHIGTFSIPFALFNNKRGKVFSFEANIFNYNLLRLNIRSNGMDEVITPMHAIVSDNKLAFTMFSPCNDNTGAYSFLPGNQPTEVDVHDVNVINVDEWYEYNGNDIKIHLIKIDIEGAELSALRSCKRLIERFKPLLYVEINKEALDRFNCTTDEIEETLITFGYRFFRNVGPRNSDNDFFKIESLNSISDGGDFFDLLAVHPTSDRFPAIALHKPNK